VAATPRNIVTLRAVVETRGSFLGRASITNTVRYTAMSPEPFKDIWR
jgi:hypothetical protein